ncbi:MAG TPA: RDD family protein [Nitrososphaeraceae archaeon]|nr:RDD family protein [Nitrososphaeraceae archaeon]
MRESRETIILANWKDRFFAWIVDFILVSIALAVLFAAIAIPTWFFYYDDGVTVAARAYQNIETFHYILSSLAFFGYWTYFEFTSGQSIGKRLLKIKTIDVSANRIGIKSAAIESFGKAFLLPIDVILGWIFTNNKRQRLFNRISNTIVIKLKKNPDVIPEDIRYTKD